MIAIIYARWNELITKALLEGAKDVALEKKTAIEVISVPGSYEIPFALQEVLKKPHIKGAVVLGCLIRGETAHFDCLAKPTFSSVQNLSLQYRKPVGNGILTVENLNQALDRAGGKLGNKGAEAMHVTLELLEKFSSSTSQRLHEDVLQ